MKSRKTNSKTFPYGDVTTASDIFPLRGDFALGGKIKDSCFLMRKKKHLITQIHCSVSFFLVNGEA